MVSLLNYRGQRVLGNSTEGGNLRKTNAGIQTWDHPLKPIQVANITPKQHPITGIYTREAELCEPMPHSQLMTSNTNLILLLAMIFDINGS